MLYPLADGTTQWFGDTYTGERITPVRLVLHSTETSGWPSYKGGASAPHLTVRADFEAKRLVWRQHFDLERSARALRNPAGGVETNHADCVQVEIVGTCDQNWSGADTLKMWDLPGWALAGLAGFVAWLAAFTDVPLVAASEWPRYPNDDHARFSGREWLAFRGVCGHLHVPENTHQDPGDFPAARLIEEARGVATPEEIWKCDIVPYDDPSTGKPMIPDNPTQQARNALGVVSEASRGAYANSRAILASLARIEKTLGEILAQLGAVTPAGIDAAGARLIERLEKVHLGVDG